MVLEVGTVFACLCLMDIIKEKSKRSILRRPIIAVPLTLGAIAVVSLLLGGGKAAPAVSRSDLWIDTVQAGEMKREIRASGTLVPRDIRWIVAGSTSTVQSVNELPGAKVKVGTVIIELSNPDLDAQQKKAEAALAGAEADVIAKSASLSSEYLDMRATQSQAESDWQLADIKAQAYQRAHDGGAVSGMELQQMRINEAQSRQRAQAQSKRLAGMERSMDAQIRAATARRDESRSALELVRRQVASLQVTAPSDGILQQIDVEPGQQVEAGAKLARVAQPNDLLARLQVPEAVAKDLALELPVSVDTRDGLVAGHIVRVDPAVRSSSVSVDVAFNGALPPGARPDLAVDGKILLGSVRNALHISRPGTASPGSTGSLFVLRKDSDRAVRTAVVYGVASSDRIEVKEGLRPGDQVILSDSSRWMDSQEVRLK